MAMVTNQPPRRAAPPQTVQMARFSGLRAV